MSSTFGRTHILFSIILVLIGVLVIVDSINKGAPGQDLQVAIGIIAIVYGVARLWFFRRSAR